MNKNKPFELDFDDEHGEEIFVDGFDVDDEEIDQYDDGERYEIDFDNPEAMYDESVIDFEYDEEE